jgi:acetoin utilization deacetylase AcuC-like enzyme/GNAT superfamily N-acetyltransferase
MFRIYRVFDARVHTDALRIAQVQAILRSQVSGLSEKKISSIPDQLNNPIKHRFRYVLFVAEDARHQVRGFALLSHEPELGFCFLDYLATATGKTGGGIGGALYDRARQEALHLGAAGIFFECLPDDPDLCPDPELRRQNRARLRFYERFGARPVVNTAYETPVSSGDDCEPYLVFDPLGREETITRARARRIVRAILERKYPGLCPPEYIDMVLASIRDPRIQLREPRYGADQRVEVNAHVPTDRRFPLVVNDRHDIHHVRERGYVESPVRVHRISEALEAAEVCTRLPVRRFSDEHLLAVHDPEYVAYLRRVCKRLGEQSAYPYVFPIRNQERRPHDLPIRAGYYCIDTFTPLNQNAYLAARRAVDCTLTTAGEILEGRRLAYALVRPPGHHAERSAFGGFCYFNNVAVAAHRLSQEGSVAILDIDYHHGNGQQQIFYRRRDVFTLSIHGHPSFAYPYFSGFADERGEGPGEGFNVNLPLPEEVDGRRYLEELRRALDRIRGFGPAFLVVALGLDPAKGDPTGTWSLAAADFERNGLEIGRLALPTLVVQEGGYRIRSLGTNALHFFRGLTAAALG